MKAKERHLMIMRLAEVQHLHVARERLQLVQAQSVTEAAEEDVQITGAAADHARERLDTLLSEPSFCPVSFGLACETLLLVESERSECEQQLEIAREAERRQHITWHQSRQKATLLDEAGLDLAKRLARARDDKRALQAVAVSKLSVRLGS